MIPAMFHPLISEVLQEQLTGEVRVFEGDGTPYLRVLGLAEVIAIHIGPMELPLTIRQRFPENGDFQSKLAVEWPLVQVAEDMDGIPILLRSIQSNDGKWQKGEKIYVRGEWDAPAAIVAPPPDVQAKKGE